MTSNKLLVVFVTLVGLRTILVRQTWSQMFRRFLLGPEGFSLPTNIFILKSPINSISFRLVYMFQIIPSYADLREC